MNNTIASPETTTQDENTNSVLNCIYLFTFLLIGGGLSFYLFKSLTVKEWPLMYIGLSIFAASLVTSFISPIIYKNLSINNVNSKYFDIQLITFSFIFLGSVLAVYAITMFKI